jgi:hypothetical protein
MKGVRLRMKHGTNVREGNLGESGLNFIAANKMSYAFKECVPLMPK